MRLPAPIALLAQRAFGRALRRVLPEESRLRLAWAAAPAELLDSYLVSGYQDPRINLQSILTRHALARRVLGSDPRLGSLMADEIRFAVELNEVLRRRAAELGVRMGAYLNPLKQRRVRDVSRAIEDRVGELQGRWAAELAERTAPRVAVLEFACGSANDYRSWAEYGLARFLDYTGVDLSPANVANARRRYPDADFRVGNILELGLPDRSFDLVVAADLFEHLSLRAMDRALGEASRLARNGVILSFFSMAEIAEHVERPERMYHWNRLSRPRIEERLRGSFPSVEVVAIASWLARCHGYRNSYNRRAYTIVAADRPLLESADCPSESDRQAAD